MVKKFQFCPEEVGCNVVGGFFGSCVMLFIIQGMLDHLFVELVKHVSAIIAREEAHSIELAVDSHRRTLVIGFWRASSLYVCPFSIVEDVFHQQRVILI